MSDDEKPLFGERRSFDEVINGKPASGDAKKHEASNLVSTIVVGVILVAVLLTTLVPLAIWLGRGALGLW